MKIFKVGNEDEEKETLLDKAAILGMNDESARDRIVEDSAGLLRMLETVLVLHEDRGNRRSDLKKLESANAKLEAENMKLENEVVDLRGKKENFVAQAKENRELKEGLAKLEEEIKLLKSAMAPAEDEVVDGHIILHEKYKEVEAVELAGDDDIDDDAEDEEDDGTSKKTVTPEDEE
jgi:cell division protein FtsB